MSRVLPYPLLTAALTLMWLILTSFSPGQLLLGIAVAVVAGQGMAALHPAKPRLRRWDLIPKLTAIVFYDIIRSNIAVAAIILQGQRRQRTSGFLTIPLDLRDPTGLAILAIIVTSTPGTAWVDYNSARGTLLLHVLDIVEEQEWVDLIKNRYEQLLLEIFE